MAKITRITEGKRFNEWAVNTYQKVDYSTGYAKGGYLKLTNQETMISIEIRNDNSLRSDKWWFSINGKYFEHKSINRVVERAIELMNNLEKVA